MIDFGSNLDSKTLIKVLEMAGVRSVGKTGHGYVWRKGDVVDKKEAIRGAWNAHVFALAQAEINEESAKQAASSKPASARETPGYWTAEKLAPLIFDMTRRALREHGALCTSDQVIVGGMSSSITIMLEGLVKRVEKDAASRHKVIAIQDEQGRFAIEEGFGSLKDFNSEFSEAVAASFEDLVLKLGELSRRIERLDAPLANMQSRLDDLSRRVAHMDKRLDVRAPASDDAGSSSAGARG